MPIFRVAFVALWFIYKFGGFQIAHDRRTLFAIVNRIVMNIYLLDPEGIRLICGGPSFRCAQQSHHHEVRKTEAKFLKPKCSEFEFTTRGIETNESSLASGRERDRGEVIGSMWSQSCHFN